jgi:hypothetical protein
MFAGLVPLIVPPLADDPLLGPVLVVAGVVYVLPAAILARQSAWVRRLIGLALLDSAAVMSCVAWLISATPLFWLPGAAALLGWGLSFPREGPPEIVPSHPEMELPPPIG